MLRSNCHVLRDIQREMLFFGLSGELFYSLLLGPFLDNIGSTSEHKAHIWPMYHIICNNDNTCFKYIISCWSSPPKHLLQPSAVRH